MAAKRTFDDQLAALEALCHEPPEAAFRALRKALAQRNNYIVGKAADLTRDLRRSDLIPDLLSAFDRFFIDPVKNDPQCWAKNAISRALAALEYQEAAVYLRGMRHIQLEPVWGGTSDSAGTLRTTCALALVQCRTLTDHQLLTYLIELFGDKEKSVRAEVARAIGQVGSQQAALLLRLRVVLGGDEPEVLGACYSGILSIEGTASIPWLSRHLESGDGVAAEAALAIAQDRSPEAFNSLRDRFASVKDPWFQSVLLSAIALTRQEEAAQFLLDLIRNKPVQAEAALEAIMRSAPVPEIVQELGQLVSGSPRLAGVFAKYR